MNRSLSTKFAQLFGQFSLHALMGCFLLGQAGCDLSKPQPGDSLYALKNPTRTWQVPQSTDTRTGKHPRLVIDSTKAELGTVEPRQTVDHVFVVKNVGEQDLSLKYKEADSAISVSAESLEIPPGESAELQVRWRPAPSVEQQSTAELSYKTNDPNRRLVRMSLCGEVRSSLFTIPGQLKADRVRPDQPSTAELYVLSQRHRDFEIAEVTSSIEGLTYDIEPVAANEISGLQALAAWRVIATLPAGLPPGELNGETLSVRAAAIPGAEQMQELVLPIQAKVQRRLAVYGGGIDKTGTVLFGVLPQGVKHQRRLVVKVNDAEASLAVEQIRTSPEFLQAKLSPYDKDPSQTNLHYLDLELPADAPEYVSRGSQLGEVHLTFAGHPRIRELKLRVDFVLQGSARKQLVELTENRL